MKVRKVSALSQCTCESGAESRTRLRTSAWKPAGGGVRSVTFSTEARFTRVRARSPAGCWRASTVALAATTEPDTTRPPLRLRVHAVPNGQALSDEGLEPEPAAAAQLIAQVIHELQLVSGVLGAACWRSATQCALIVVSGEIVCNKRLLDPKIGLLRPWRNRAWALLAIDSIIDCGP